MICAQKVSLTSWLQAGKRCGCHQDCCDLRSKSIFDILITGTTVICVYDNGCDLRSKSIFDILITGIPFIQIQPEALWFALKKYLWHPDYRLTIALRNWKSVVICAQKVSLTSWLQVGFVGEILQPGCDLRSKSIFDILITGHRTWLPYFRQVVICAQKVSLTSWLQVEFFREWLKRCCDLRSKSIFDILITGMVETVERKTVLWFALKKYLWHPDYR